MAANGATSDGVAWGLIDELAAFRGVKSPAVAFVATTYETDSRLRHLPCLDISHENVNGTGQCARGNAAAVKTNAIKILESPLD